MPRVFQASSWPKYPGGPSVEYRVECVDVKRVGIAKVEKHHHVHRLQNPRDDMTQRCRQWIDWTPKSGKRVLNSVAKSTADRWEFALGSSKESNVRPFFLLVSIVCAVSRVLTLITHLRHTFAANSENGSLPEV